MAGHLFEPFQIKQLFTFIAVHSWTSLMLSSYDWMLISGINMVNVIIYLRTGDQFSIRHDINSVMRVKRDAM